MSVFRLCALYKTSLCLVPQLLDPGRGATRLVNVGMVGRIPEGSWPLKEFQQTATLFLSAGIVSQPCPDGIIFA
jgi:hypothetical protein